MELFDAMSQHLEHSSCDTSYTDKNWHNSTCWRGIHDVMRGDQGIPANKEPFLNQLACVILVHKWYRSTSMCFHVYSCEYTCSTCCHEF